MFAVLGSTQGKPITSDTANAAIQLFGAGHGRGNANRQGTGGTVQGGIQGRRLQEAAPAAGTEAGTAAALASVHGMVDSLSKVALALARGATPADAFVPAGSSGAYVSGQS